jgi:sugar O-acyltransferase (sialic acid O-acetyltransferase NeuD family)
MKPIPEFVVLGDGALAREMVDLITEIYSDVSKIFLASPADEVAIVDSLPEAHLVLGVAKPAVRHSQLLRFQGRSFPVLLHPRAGVSRSANLGRGTVVCAGAVVGPGAILGSGCLVNWNATLGHDCRLEGAVCVSPQAAVSGRCQLGRRTFVGAGAVILEGMNCGADSVIGAGAVVTHSVAAGATVVGVPSRPLSSP